MGLVQKGIFIYEDQLSEINEAALPAELKNIRKSI